MTNEELAINIKDGITELIPVLWEQINRFMYCYVDKFYFSRQDMFISAVVTKDDLRQESYFVMLKMIENYNADKDYSFLSYVDYSAKNIFNSLIGIRTSKINTLNVSVSLDKPLNDEDDVALVDTISDNEDDIAEAEKRMYLEQLRQDLNICIESLPKVESEIVCLRYYKGMTFKGISDKTGVPWQKARRLEAAGLRKLRTGNNLKRLKAYREDIINRHAYKSSFSIWNNTGYSSTEYTALKLIGETE